MEDMNYSINEFLEQKFIDYIDYNGYYYTLVKDNKAIVQLNSHQEVYAFILGFNYNTKNTKDTKVEDVK